MYDKKLVLNSLLNIQKALALISERTENIHQVDDFLRSPDGMVLLDAICMNLIALGETTKGLDKITKGTLWAFYPEIIWQGIMRTRDKIAHHYFDIDAEVVFNTIKEDIPLVIPVINRMIADLEET